MTKRLQNYEGSRLLRLFTQRVTITFNKKCKSIEKIIKRKTRKKKLENLKKELSSILYSNLNKGLTVMKENLRKTRQLLEQKEVEHKDDFATKDTVIKKKRLNKQQNYVKIWKQKERN